MKQQQSVEVMCVLLLINKNVPFPANTQSTPHLLYIGLVQNTNMTTLPYIQSTYYTMTSTLYTGN